MNDTITYEQPLTEHMRICLRVESLLQRIKRYMVGDSTRQSVLALAGLIELLGVIERPDLKSKLVKAMSDVSESLSQLSRQPTIAHALDQDKLDRVLRQLQTLLVSMHQEHKRIGLPLYENTFLRSVRCYLTTPGGTCHFNAPEYHLWLRQPPAQRQKDLSDWLNVLSDLQKTTALLLMLARESADTERVVANQGFYQCTLNPNKAGQMMRVIVASDLGLYPVFSVGRHRCALHFYKPCFHGAGRPQKYDEDLEFDLAYCSL